MKLDGYRALLIRDGEGSRFDPGPQGFDGGYPSVAAAARTLDATRVVVDGEIVAIDPAGAPRSSPHTVPRTRAHHRLFCVRSAAPGQSRPDGPALDERLPRLAGWSRGPRSFCRVSCPGTPRQYRGGDEPRPEGVIAKRRSSRYIPGERHSAWVKLKLDRQQEFFIGGYRPCPHGIDAILVGYHDDRGLRFAERSEPALRLTSAARSSRDWRRRNVALPVSTCRTPKPRVGGGVTADQMAEMQWVRPTAVAQVRFVRVDRGRTSPSRPHSWDCAPTSRRLESGGDVRRGRPVLVNRRWAMRVPVT